MLILLRCIQGKGKARRGRQRYLGPSPGPLQVKWFVVEPKSSSCLGHKKNLDFAQGRWKRRLVSVLGRYASLGLLLVPGSWLLES